MSERTFQTTIAAMVLAMLGIVATAWTLEAAATINEYQERQAEALCQADPSLCGDTRR